MPSLSLKDFKRRLRRDYTVATLNVFGEPVECLLKCQDDGSHVPLACFVEDSWSFNVPPSPVYMQTTDELPSPITNFVGSCKNFAAMKVEFRGHEVFMAFHVYQRDGSFVITATLILFDNNLREQVCEWNPGS